MIFNFCLRRVLRSVILYNLVTTRQRVESVKALKYQPNNMKEALLTVADEKKPSKVRSKADSLANNNQGNIEFILATVVWYDILFAVNTISKTLEAADIQLDIAAQQVEWLFTQLKKYQDNGFPSALITAKQITCEMGTEKASEIDQDVRPYGVATAKAPCISKSPSD